MQHCEQLRLELNLAKEQCELIRTAKSLIDIESHWKKYLHHIERVWTKSLSHYSKSPKWNGWQGSYLKLRTKDELLSYLINARGADEHTIAEIVSKEPGVMALNPVRHGAPLLIKEMIFDAHGNITKAEFGSDVHVISRPSRVRLLEVTNRGRTYPAPTLHLGKSVNPDNIIEIANLGIDFYEDFLNKADNFFIK